MKLELAHHRVADLSLQGPTRLEEGCLYFDPEDVNALLPAESAIFIKNLAVATPGGGQRMAPVLDVVEPRAKAEPDQGAFPGFGSSPQGAGQGRTHVLSGMALLAVADLPGAQEGVVDMSPEAADFCPFARTLNLVLDLGVKPGASRVAADHAVRELTLGLAERLASLARGQEPERLEIWERAPLESALPRVALVYLVQSQGDLRRTYLYGHPVDEILPTMLDPLEVLDGAVVSGNFVMPSNKTCTYIHQNNPLVRELLTRHGHELNFAGVVVANEMSRMADKERSAAMAAGMVRGLGAEGAIINQEGGGNTITDVMMLCRRLEGDGVKTVLVLNEFAGEDGTTPSLAETTPEAVAIVSAGNNDHRLELPAAMQLIGQEVIPGVHGVLRGPISLPLGRLHSSTNQMGFNNLSCVSL
ncbi:MAG: glycine/sarcosine/betaine reductase component B subunit [Proteobacteria bacterium]|nr:glycine/sarcosine/betaine reductase component B subunit [Pseudomonadota bacterium]